jgi:UDP-GlcNAc:undecaprenyl-phosphate GlcNAc-1-phosphate transferase
MTVGEHFSAKLALYAGSQFVQLPNNDLLHSDGLARMDALLFATVFAMAILLSATLTPVVLKLARVYNLFDHPDVHLSTPMSRRIHSTPIPRIGGIAIVISFLMSYVVWHKSQGVGLSLLVSSLLIFAVGIIDDIYSLSARLRFFFQVVICLYATIAADLVLDRISIMPGLQFETPWSLGVALSVFILVGAINALNMIDGLDGLAGGMSMITILFLAFLYNRLSGDDNALLFFSVPVIGAILGFLKYNTHPASIFMGDSGSNWLGFIIGVHILLVAKVTLHSVELVNVSIVSPLMTFAVPIADTAYVMYARFRMGLPVMSADKRHFHHSLLKLGLSQSQSVSFIYLIAIIASIFGTMPAMYPKYNFSLMPYIGAVLVSFAIIVLDSVSSGTFQGRFIGAILRFVNRRSQVSPLYNATMRYWERANKYCIFLILAISPLFAGKIHPTFGYAAIPVTVLLLSTFVMKSRKNDFFEPLVITLGCIVLLVAYNQNPLQIMILGQTYSIQSIYNGLFIFLLFSSIGFIFFTIKRNYLILTPTDFLVLSLPLVLLIFPDQYMKDYHLGIISLRSMIVFLAYRTLEKRRFRSRRPIKWATLIALIHIMLISLLGLRIVY